MFNVGFVLSIYLQALRGKMNAKPRKDESDERDEPLASEDEVEHEVGVFNSSRYVDLKNALFT